jgi:hypothetical protein
VSDSYETITKSLSAFALGAIYYALPLREWANQPYFDRVNQNLVSQLTRPFAGDPQFPTGLTWRQIRSTFYHFVDSDKSQETLMGLAYWNGAIWTSAADLRVISGIGAVIMALIMLAANLIGDVRFDSAKSTYVFLLLIGLFLTSIALSELTTRRHIHVGTEQAENILQDHLAELKARLIAAASR